MHADMALQTSKQELARVCMQSTEFKQSCMTGESKGVQAGGGLEAVVTVVTTRPSTRPGVRGTVRPSGSTKGFSPMSLIKLLMNTSNPKNVNQSINLHSRKHSAILSDGNMRTAKYENER